MPVASVVALPDPISVAPAGPLAIDALTAAPAVVTGLPCASRICTTGWVVNGAPTAVPFGCVTIASWAAMP